MDTYTDIIKDNLNHKIKKKDQHKLVRREKLNRNLNKISVTVSEEYSCFFRISSHNHGFPLLLSQSAKSRMCEEIR